MEELNIPIFKKTYELYKTFYACKHLIPKQERYSIWQKNENLILDILEGIFAASNLSKTDKLPVLEKTSTKLNLLKILVRLTKDIKVIDSKKYLVLEAALDEIGRMLGGWIKSVK